MITALRIITKDEAEDMVATWNSAAWFAKEETIQSAKYFVCVKPNSREPFLIAEIESFRPVPESGRNRWALMFRDYAQVDRSMIEIVSDIVSDIRRPSQNPLIRFNLEEALKLPLDKLPWERVPTERRPEWSFERRIKAGGSVRRSDGKANVPGMSVAEAKRALAAHFGVPEEAITITIQA